MTADWRAPALAMGVSAALAAQGASAVSLAMRAPADAPYKPGPGVGAPKCCTGNGMFSLHQGPAALGQQLPEWRANLLKWRNETVSQYKLTFPVYDEPRLAWTRTTQVQPQVHPWDRFLYDEKTHQYTVDRYLDDLKQRYGGIDSVLLWPTYPTIGIDARNQFDLWRAMPGGVQGVKKLVQDFHDRGVKVLFPFNPFDQGLRDEGVPNWVTLVEMLKLVGADGFNGDTMYTMPKQIYQHAMDLDHPIAGEMENGGYANPYGWDFDNTWASADWNNLGWGYYFAGSLSANSNSQGFWGEPGVDKAKWLDTKGRRNTHVCDRWAMERHDAMQYAHFNGVGYTSWENVWGMFIRFTDRDAEALRRIQTVWRWLRDSEFLQNYADWFPFAPEISAVDVYSSRWVHSNGTCAWTVVNRGGMDQTFDLVTSSTSCIGDRLIDLITGQDVPQSGRSIEALGYGAYLLTSEKWTPPGLEPLLKKMRPMSMRPLSNFSSNWHSTHQVLLPQEPAKPVATQPADTVLIPRAHYNFMTAGVEIEGGCDASQDKAKTGVCCGPGFICPSNDERCFNMCGFDGGDYYGVDFQFPWEPYPGRFHSQWLDLGPFYIDKHLVTNKQWASYVAATGYRPRDSYNYLKGWTNQTHYKPGDDKKPVTWISISEARAYCAWAGKRLPHVWEWQLAAQGTDDRIYPWGNDDDKTKYPKPDTGRVVPELPDVGSFPDAQSPYNVSDLVGFVWQFTDSWEDDHTRAVLLKGSSLYNPQMGGGFPAVPQVGNWYFPVARKLQLHNKLMLFDDSYERAETLGLRCVAEHPEGAKGPLHLHGHAPTKEELLQQASFV